MKSYEKSGKVRKSQEKSRKVISFSDGGGNFTRNVVFSEKARKSKT